jgi:hypothetical protein
MNSPYQTMVRYCAALMKLVIAERAGVLPLRAPVETH